MAGNEGPTILWESLKGKKVKSNDGEDLGEIKEISQNYIRLEKGTVNKKKYWVPKYVADAYDGDVLWLIISGEDAVKSYAHGEEPPVQQYSRDFEAFRTTPYGQKAVFSPNYNQNIRVIEGRKSSVSDTAAKDYKNIRELDE